MYTLNIKYKTCLCYFLHCSMITIVGPLRIHQYLYYVIITSELKIYYIL